MDNNKRLDYFDIAKGIGIILVIIAHIEYVDQGIRNYIVSFHMPLFFIISGMLMYITGEKERPVKNLLLKKLRRIMLVYLVFSVIYLIIDVIYYYVTGIGPGWNGVRADAADSVMLYGISVLWFLPALFFGEVIFLVLLKLIKNDFVSVLCTFILMAVVFIPLRYNQNHFVMTFVRFFICAAFVSVGYILQKLCRSDKIQLFLSRLHMTRLFYAAAGLLLLVIIFSTERLNGTVDMHFSVYGNIFLYIITSILGSIGIILLSCAIAGTGSSFISKTLIFYGKNSLTVMITHINFYILYAAEVLSFHFSKYISHAKLIIFNIMIVLFVLAAEIPVIIIYDLITKKMPHPRNK